MSARGRGEAFDFRAIQSPAIDVNLDGTVLAGGEVDPARSLVDAIDLSHFPVPVGELAPHHAGRLEVIEVVIAVASGEPEKRSVLEPERLASEIPVDKSGTGLVDQGCRGACLAVGEIDVQPCLLPILQQENDLTAVGRPADANDKVIG